jgi:hypothetical protein
MPSEDFGAIGLGWDAMKNLFLRGLFLFAIGIGAAAHAADMPVKAPITAPPPIERWTFSLTPYLWATSLNGSTTVKGRTIDVDASFIDIVEHTEIPKNLFQPGHPCRPPHSCRSMQLHMGLGTASDPARQRIERNLGDAV